MTNLPIREPDEPVFTDPSGRRARQVRLASAVIIGLAAFLLFGFISSLVISPHLGGTAIQHGQHTKSFIAKRAAEDKFQTARTALLTKISEQSQHSKEALTAPRSAPIAGAYFAPWEDAGIDSFLSHADQLTHVYPAWIELQADGRTISTKDWDPTLNEATERLVAIARTHGVKIVPLVMNASEGQFDEHRVMRMLDDKAAAENVAEDLFNFVQANSYDGLQLDFEEVPASAIARLAVWADALRLRMHSVGKELSLTLEAGLKAPEIRALAKCADYVVVMAYDEHDESGSAGPIASASFVSRTLATFVPLVGQDKFVLGIGAYGYDWTTKSAQAASITNEEAVSLAAGYRDEEKPQDVIDFDPKALNPTFEYTDENDQDHEVWFLDAVTAANTLKIAQPYHLRGASMWALGMEDPSTWQVFGRASPDVPDLNSVIFPLEAQFIGDGELLQVLRSPQAGARTFETDAKTGLIDDEVYTEYPSSWLVQRSGAPDHTLALTFDDGPDPQWTPKILDVLKQNDVKASFFMIGANAADYPDLVSRVFAEGHEIGNHSFTHPNMAFVTQEQVRLELAACQRALEAILGRSTILFRPPYNADSEPRSFGELMPVAIAGKMGYVTAGETIDPLDWDTVRKSPDGSTHRLGKDEILASIRQQLTLGHAILLHDAGGDRSATVAALAELIPELKAQGYRFVPIGELAGLSRTQTMPEIKAADRPLAILDSVFLTVTRILSAIIFWGFSGAIVLGLLRIILMMFLAARSRLLQPAPLQVPRIDVLIAAFNEAPVIAKTIASVLESRDVDVQVIVVDDGSTDGTAQAVADAFGTDKRVQLLSKPNGGKASALNVALTKAVAPIVVGVDADTQLDPLALANLARWFADPKIGAVAGNVKVGNRVSLVTRWQALEYVTSQNIDRRALAQLNAITVVPGAIGAWRMSALQDLGGYRQDTLAEDMDLTWRMRMKGWVVANEPAARAYTEAPHDVRSLLKQRFRWSFGTLQCLWKYRSALFHYGWFGSFALPSLWLFQIVVQIFAPFVDLQLAFTLLNRAWVSLRAMQHVELTPAPDPMTWVIIGIYVAFVGLEIAAGWLAFRLEGIPSRDLWLLPTQRLIYRQTMYIAVWRAVGRALTGMAQGWGKIKREGTVRVAQ